jgi:hypothetical protein
MNSRIRFAMHARVGLFVFCGCLMLAGCGLRSIPFVNKSLQNYDEEKEKRLDELISKNEELRLLAKVCQGLGSLRNFKLLSRSIATHGPPELYYYYHSDLPFSETTPVFTSFLESDGWRAFENSSMNPTIAFRKDSFIVIIQHGGIGEAEYGITCGKETKKQA